MNAASKTLTDYMSELSEEAYFASWMDGLEFALWRAVLEGPRQYGRLDITPEHIVRLRELSDSCGGWIYFDESTEQTFIPASNWDKMYSERISEIGKYIS